MQEAREEEEALSAEEESLTDEVAAEDKNGRHLFVGRIRCGVTLSDSQPTISGNHGKHRKSSFF